jgi:hypothetical protein
MTKLETFLGCCVGAAIDHRVNRVRKMGIIDEDRRKDLNWEKSQVWALVF